MENTILIVEDEQAIADLIRMNLRVAGYKTYMACDGMQAEAILKEQPSPDLAVVDVMLPGENGFELMGIFKKYGIPVIYLTAKADVTSKVYGLRLGAEDYMVKPFEVLELLIRIEKVLERQGKKKETIDILPDIVIDLLSHEVLKGGEKVLLKPMEYDLLVFLARSKNKAFSRNQLLNEIWGSEFMGETRTVDVHIAQLRKKLNLENIIETIPKLGYRLGDRS